MMSAAVRSCLFLLLCVMSVSAADAPMAPVTVCEFLKNPAAYEGKPVLLIGRYSFRSTGRFIGEEACGEQAAAGATPAPAVLWLAADDKAAPKVPPVLQIDAKIVDRKLEEIRRRTSLGHFRFGSADYDRWAAVYGEVEKRPEPAVTPVSAKSGEPEAPPVRLLIRGDGAIVFLGDE